MTTLNFYVLSTAEESARLNFCARLVEKAFSKGHKILVVCESHEQAQSFDKTLWTFKEESFIPHLCIDECAPGYEAVPVLVSDDVSFIPDECDVCISLSYDVIPHFDQFNRFIEVVDQSEVSLQSSRQHFKYYRQQGYEITTHKI